MNQPSGRLRRLLRRALAPAWAALFGALSAGLPFAAPLLLPFGAGRLGAALLAEGPWTGFLLAALSIPVALFVGAVISPGGGVVLTVLVLTFVTLPAVGLYGGARDGRRRDRLLLVVASLCGVGGLAALLGVAFATGRDPGGLLAARWGGAVPELLAFYRSSGWPEGSVTAASRLFELVRVALRDELPGLVLAAATIHAALVVYPFGRLSGLEKRGLAEPGFGRFKTPLTAAVVFIPAGLLAALGSGELRRPAIDVLLPVVVLFFFRGLAIIRVLLDTGRVGFLGRTLAYVVLFQMPFPLVLALGGLFDEFLDVRGRFSRWIASRGGGGRDGS